MGGERVIGTVPPTRGLSSEVGGTGGRDWEFVQNFFNILDTFPFTNYTYRGIIINR